MKYRLAAIAAVCLACSQALSADFGLGTSLDFDEPILYVPIDIGPKFRIEPFISYSQEKSETIVYGANSPYTVVASQNRMSSSIGVGVFGVGAVSESVAAYYGARLKLISIEDKLKYDDGSRPPAAVLNPKKSTSEGVALIPTFGLEYRFATRISAAIEATVAFSAVDGDDTDTKSTKAGADIIVRYRF